VKQEAQRREFLSVVIPAYNESERILPTLPIIDEYCRMRFRRYEIIVVNDGSSDGTGEVVRREQLRTASLRYEGYEPNRGKGYALRRGIAVSGGEIILVSDADLSTPIEEIEKLLASYDEGYDIVIGSRALKESDIMVRQPLWRVWMGKTFNRIVRVTLSMEFWDTQCGFKLFRGDVCREIFSHAMVDRFAYDVEILLRALQDGLRIREVPVRWMNSPSSKVRLLKDSLQMLKDIAKVRARSSLMSRRGR
jgi:dolichyl-phosphate beta-glucosyltransferase